MTRENLMDLSVKHKTDKWGAHHYAKHYERHLAHFRDKKVVMLEIGIGGYADPFGGGASLRVWSDWFTHSETVIVGVDIHEKRMKFDDPRVRVHRGSQIDIAFLEELHDLYGDFDIVLDDGSHLPEHVITTFKFLYPRTRDGGIYIVEDTQTSYWEGGRASRASYYNPENPTISFFKSLPDWINYAEVPLPSDPSFYDLHTVGAHFYHNLIVIDKDRNVEKSNLVPSRVGREVVDYMKPLIAVPLRHGVPRMGLLAHVGGVGDVRNEDIPSVVTDGRHPRFIQGIRLLCGLDDEKKVEYRVRLQSGDWTEWVCGNRYAGTRGKNESLSGFSVRLAGDWVGKYDLLMIGSFQSLDGLILRHEGSDCITEEGGKKIAGMQILFLPSATSAPSGY
ncbi:Methyltransferase domain-containing protein [Pseudoxanthomonas sp. GM95]|nr:Methyltransferase domain-containing protein [Pseudoxanthomonas sp. GM95]